MGDPAARPAAAAVGQLVLTCWGVRGSIPAPGPGTARYGGNTPAAELQAADGRRLLLDAGTGLRPLGSAWAVMAASAPGEDPETISVLVSHAHGDHLHGLGFFAPLTIGRARVTLYTGESQVAAVEAGVRLTLGPPLFPMVDGLLDRVRVEALDPDRPTMIAGFAVRPVTAAHPGGAAGFRIEDPQGGGGLVYLPDNEIAAIDTEMGGRGALCEAIAGVELLIHDATYLPSELLRHRGWGHSSYAEAVALASEAGVRRLLLHHHHPARDDGAVDQLLEEARALGARAEPVVRVEAAREGVAVEIG